MTPDDQRAELEQAVSDRLTAELDARRLVLPPERRAAAESNAARDGDQLMTEAIHRCYPLSRHGSQTVTARFDDHRAAGRVRSTLAFGAATAAVFTSPQHHDGRSDGVRLLGAVFNLGIGLLDGLCDEVPEIGRPLLELIHEQDVLDAARHPRRRGWLSGLLPVDLESDATASFAAAVVEAVFDLIHEIYAGDPWSRLRHQVGEQLMQALDAERLSVRFGREHAPPDLLIRSSYTTSVRPFEIVGTLAHAGGPPPAARLLGEAMWRIDDLIDLCADAEAGALNALLVEAAGDDVGPAVLDQLLASDVIGRAAAEAAESLATAMQLLGDRRDQASSDVIVAYVGRYAGIPPTGEL